MGGAIFAILVLAGFVFIMFMIGRSNAQQDEELRKVQADYQQALNALRANPLDPNLKNYALSVGRAYSNISRNRGGVTVYDEMAIMNDINAATAGAYMQAQQQAPVAYHTPQPSITTNLASAPSVAERLRKLDDLKSQGLVSDEEYAARRTKILDEV